MSRVKVTVAAVSVPQLPPVPSTADPKSAFPPPPLAAWLTQVVPFEVSTLPDVPGATADTTPAALDTITPPWSEAEPSVSDPFSVVAPLAVKNFVPVTVVSPFSDTAPLPVLNVPLASEKSRPPVPAAAVTPTFAASVTGPLSVTVLVPVLNVVAPVWVKLPDSWIWTVDTSPLLLSIATSDVPPRCRSMSLPAYVALPVTRMPVPVPPVPCRSRVNAPVPLYAVL